MSPQTNFPSPNKAVTAMEPSLATKVFASVLGTGYSPVASGTAGSAAALVFYCIPGFESLEIIGSFILIIFILGIRTAAIMERRYGHDPAEVTIDEVVGMWISLVLLPKKIFIITAGFLLFRFFDIIKPFPARKFDVMRGGFGIMMDDVIAGIYTNVMLQLALFIPTISKLFMR